jgi:transcriptional regulator with XRE-family HTH domain
MTDTLTVGERVAWYRRRRGLTQEVLAGLAGRTVDWLGKIENDRIPLDRLSVIKDLADVLDVTVGDLIAEPSLLDWTAESGRTTVPNLRAALMDYRQLTPALAGAVVAPPPLASLRTEVAAVWDAYQQSRYGFVVSRLPALLEGARGASRAYGGDDAGTAASLLAMTYQAAAMILTKLGETDLAWMAADRGLSIAHDSGNPVIVGSLFRSVTHSLLSHGRHAEAVALTHVASDYLRPGLAAATPEYLSIYGTLFLAGSMAAARNEDRATTRAFLDEADGAARQLGRDGNHFWTAFGPTNVAIHRVSAAMELGDVQVALDLGPQVDASVLPMERQIRHAIELSRAYSARNHRDQALSVLLDAERLAPEQVRHHYHSRQLVLTWIKRERGTPRAQLVGLAQRLKVA